MIENFFLLSFQCCVIGYVYVEILIQNGMLLSPFYTFLERKLTKQISIELPDNTPAEVKDLPGYRYTPVYQIERKQHWLLKVLGACIYCTCGQLALWALSMRSFVLPWLPSPIQHGLSFAWHFAFTISLTLFLVLFIRKIIQRWST